MRHARLALFLMIFAASAGSARADAVGAASGLPIPRFVSLKADKVNVHVGPAKHYEVKWVYQRAGLPVEITAEFENWRRVRDADGTEGWIYHSLLSGRRTGQVKRCDAGWCYIAGRGYQGWIQQVRLWGVYPNEKVE